MDKLCHLVLSKLGENLSFNGTAQHFGVPASKVSRAIKSQEHLGVTLVEYDPTSTPDRDRYSLSR